MQNCDRCNKPTDITIMSKFNTEMICTDCKRREKAHPLYPQADAAETAAVRNGNYNFPGTGCPADLYQPEQQSKSRINRMTRLIAR